VTIGAPFTRTRAFGATGWVRPPCAHVTTAAASRSRPGIR
jgi:hypothetical protein